MTTQPTAPSLDEQIKKIAAILMSYDPDNPHCADWQDILASLRELKRIREAERPEPVAGWMYEFHEFGDVWARHIILNRPDGGSNPPTKHHGSAVRNVRPVYGPEVLAYADRLQAERDQLERDWTAAATLNMDQGMRIGKLEAELAAANHDLTTLHDSLNGEVKARLEAEAERDAARKGEAYSDRVALEHQDKRAAAESALAKARSVVNEQAEDTGLWLAGPTIAEDMLQRALRRLHAAVEGRE